MSLRKILLSLKAKEPLPPDLQKIVISYLDINLGQHPSSSLASTPIEAAAFSSIEIQDGYEEESKKEHTTAEVVANRVEKIGELIRSKITGVISSLSEEFKGGPLWIAGSAITDSYRSIKQIESALNNPQLRLIEQGMRMDYCTQFQIVIENVVRNYHDNTLASFFINLDNPPNPFEKSPKPASLLFFEQEAAALNSMIKSNKSQKDNHPAKKRKPLDSDVDGTLNPLKPHDEVSFVQKRRKI